MNLETCYTQHAAKAQSLAYHLLRNADDADDAVSEAVTRIAPKVESIAENEVCKVWLGIVRHVSYDILRQRRKVEDMTEYELTATLDRDYASASDPRERKGSESPIGVDLVQWVLDACETPAQYNLCKAYLDCPSVETLAVERKTTSEAIYMMLSRLGKHLGAKRKNLRAEIKLALRLRESWGKGSSGGKSRRSVPRNQHVIGLIELCNLEGTLVGENTLKSPMGNGAWVTERTDAYGWSVALTPAKLELPYQGMLSCYSLC